MYFAGHCRCWSAVGQRRLIPGAIIGDGNNIEAKRNYIDAFVLARRVIGQFHADFVD